MSHINYKCISFPSKSQKYQATVGNLMYFKLTHVTQKSTVKFLLF